MKKERNMKRRIVFFDIDGTLFDGQKRLVQSAKAAIEQLQAKGIYVVIATGRSPFMFGKLRQELGVQSFISFNGSYVVHENKVIYKSPLQAGKLAELDRVARMNDHPLVFLNEKAHYTNARCHNGIAMSLGELHMDYPEYEPEFYMNHKVYQALLYCEKNEEHEYREMCDSFDYVRWHDLSIDVLPKGGSKAKGIACLLDELQINREDAIAFGDGLNDIEMLSYVGTGVAMGNGHDEVKRVADYVTTHVEEDGIMNGLKDLGLI